MIFQLILLTILVFVLSIFYLCIKRYGNLTKTQNLPIASRFKASKQKVDRLFTREKITRKDLEDLDKPERGYLMETCTELLRSLKGAERDKFLDQVDAIMTSATKSDIWDGNHSAISSAVADYMREHGVMPTKHTLAEKTGLSRKTVAKHLANYKNQPEFAEQAEQFKFMAPAVLANVFKASLNGDMRAARLYLEMVGSINKKGKTVVNEQNNYIQVNNTILSQENLKQLTAEQLDQIERIVTNNGIKKNREVV